MFKTIAQNDHTGLFTVSMFTAFALLAFALANMATPSRVQVSQVYVVNSAPAGQDLATNS